MTDIPQSPPLAAESSVGQAGVARRASRKQRGFFGWLGIVAASFGLLLVFLISFVISVGLHLNTAACRRAVAQIVTQAVSGQIRGSVYISSIRRLGFGGLELARAEVRDPDGRVVAEMQDVAVSLQGLAFAKSYVTRELSARKIDSIYIRRIDLNLLDDGHGLPTLLASFEPKVAAIDTGAPAGPLPTISLAALDVDTLAIHSRLSGRVLDAELGIHRAGMSLSPDGMRVTLPSLDAAAAGDGLAMPVAIQVSGAVSQSVGPDGKRLTGAKIVLVVDTGRSKARLEATMQQEVFELGLDANIATVDFAKWAFLPELEPLSAGESNHLVAHVVGPLEKLVVKGDLVTRLASIQWEGQLNVLAASDLSEVSRGLTSPKPLASLTLGVRNIDLHQIAKSAPELRYDLSTNIELNATREGLTGKVDGDIHVRDEPSKSKDRDPLLLWLRPVVVSFAGNVGLTASNAVRDANLRVGVARGADLIGVEASLSDGNIDWMLHSKMDSLRELAPLVGKGHLAGALYASLRGAVDLTHHVARVSGDLDIPDLTQELVRLKRVKVSLGVRAGYAKVDGPNKVEEPSGSVNFSGYEASLMDKKTGRAAATFLGLGAHIDFEGDKLSFRSYFDTDQAQHVHLAAALERTKSKALLVRNIDARLSRGRFVALVTGRQVTVSPAGIDLDGIRLASTAGGLRVDGRLAPNGIPQSVNFASTDMDVDQLMYGLALPELPFSGVVRVDGKLVAASGGRMFVGQLGVAGTGTIREKGKTGKAVSVDFATALTLEAKRVALTGHVEVADVTRFAIEGESSATRDTVASFLAAPGHFDLTAKDIDVSKALRFVRAISNTPSDGIDTDIRGQLGIEMHLARTEVNGDPSLLLRLDGKQLQFHTPALALEALDIKSSTRIVPNTIGGIAVETEGDIAEGAEGKLVGWNASATLPAKWVQNALRGNVSVDGIEKLPIVARLSIPERPFGKLPAGLRVFLPAFFQAAPEGKDKKPATVAANFSWTGTVLTPKATLNLKVNHLPVGRNSSFGLVSDIEYDGKKAILRNTIRQTDGAGQLDLTAEVGLALRDLLQPRRPLVWTGSMELKARELPLNWIPEVAAAGVGGRLTGEISVVDLHRAGATPEVKVDLRVTKLRLRDIHFDLLHLTGNASRSASLIGKLDGGGGSATIAIKSPLMWKDTLVPEVATGGPLDLAITTKGLRLASFASLVPSLDELDGRLDADLRLTAKPPPMSTGSTGKPSVGSAPTWTLVPRGTLHVREGVLNVASVGERWDNMEASFELGPDALDLKKLTLRSRGGRGSAEIHARLGLAALLPTSIHAEIKTSRFAVASDGVALGEVSGKVVVDGRLDGKLPKIVAVLDAITVDLAASTEKKPQSLETDPSIHVEQPIGPKASVATGSPFAMELGIEIPDTLWIRRDDLLVALRGGPTIVLGRSPSYRGEISITRGRVDVLGKRFEIGPSKARFSGTADLDPSLEIEATWQAPDDSVVTVSIGGRLRSPKLTFSASPTATDGQIMNLLVLGRRDAGTASAQETSTFEAGAQTAAIASALTASILGGQLQRMLPTNLTVSVRPGAAGFADARIAAGYQWNRIYIEVGYNAGVQNNATATVTRPTTTVGVEWRFAQQWSLATSLGDTGSSLVDLVWQFRY